MSEFALSLPDSFQTLLALIGNAKSPRKTKRIEEDSAAEAARAKEQGDYEKFVNATLAYILARRRTTELIRPKIKHGGRGFKDVTLEGFGFTKLQWFRRVKELEIPDEKLEEYFTECVAFGWHPSLNGAVSHYYGKSKSSTANNNPVTVHVCPNCGHVME